MKKTHLTLLTAFLSLQLGWATAMEARQPQTVVELYTSQGCSSCPPADALMGQLVQNKDVLGLSFAVTYWDYIGWPDTFGAAENDQRQARYRDRMGARYVYTPQMVIAGKEHFVGSDRGKLSSRLDKYNGHARKLPLSWKVDGDKITIELPELGKTAIIWQMDMDNIQEVNVGRGENDGKRLSYHNIVRDTHLVSNWNGQKTTLTLDLSKPMTQGRTGCAILIQEDGDGPILAALMIDL